MEGCADGAWDERVGESCGDLVDGLPAGAVGWHEQRRSEAGERVDGRPDDRLEHRPAEVKPADDRRDALLAGQLLRVADRVHDARVTAATQDDEPLVT